jgi:hypothetical protein
VGAGDEPEELPPSKARAFLERQTLPSPTRAKQVARWYATEGSKGVWALLVQLPLTALKELVPISVGLGRIVAGWARWMSVTHYAATIAAAEGSDKAKHQKEVEARKSGRRKLSLGVFLLLVGGGVWTWFHYPLALVLVGGLFVIACDAVGRAGTEKSVDLPPPMRTVLKEGVPLSQVTATVVETLLREGLEVGIARPMRYDTDRREYSLELSCLDEIRAEHLRAIERGVGADDHTARNLATGVATNRLIVIRDGDPLADFVERPWIDSGSRSIAEPLDLGVSMTEVPFELTFAGVHIRVVGASGSGKTKWFLRSCIDRVSACRDVVIGGIDLTNGPELALWRGVIQKRAFTPEDADKLLDWALAQIEERGKILTAIAEDDDPTNDVDEWHSGLGPAIVIFADEFSQTAEFDGKGGKLNLLGKCEQIVRTGRKHWVSLVMLTQKTGNSDFGSQTMTSQCATSVMLACDPRDTVTMVGVERRDMGYAPHLLSPGVEGDPRDAGKTYLDSPRHRTPDIYRAYAPGTTAEVKRRARQRLEDGLPSLRSVQVEQDAAVVPEALLLMEEVFAKYDADKLPTAMILEYAGASWTDMSLADALRPHAVTSHKSRNDYTPGKSVMCYYRAEVQAALESL